MWFNNSVDALVEEYRSVHFEDVTDHKKNNFYSLVHHSAAIEGSKLSALETALLLDDDIESRKILFHDELTVMDHYKGLLFTIDSAGKKLPISVEFLKSIAHLIDESFDISKGDFQNGFVKTGNGRSYLKIEKMPERFDRLCADMNERMLPKLTTTEQLLVAFDGHLQFSEFRPFGDGTWRAGRLVMNYIQFYYDLPPSIIRKESLRGYIEALRASFAFNAKNDLTPIRRFLFVEYTNQLQTDIKNIKRKAISR